METGAAKEKWELIEVFRRYATVDGYGRRSCGEDEEEAVEVVMDLLSETEKRAVRSVYMYAPREAISASKIRGRVRRVAYETYYSEVTVYRMLARARELLKTEMKIRRPTVL